MQQDEEGHKAFLRQVEIDMEGFHKVNGKWAYIGGIYWLEKV